METSTPKAGDKSGSLGGDVSELKYSKGSGNVTCEKETENNSQRLSIIIQIEDKRDGKAAEDESGSSPGQDRSRQILGGRQTQDGSRTDCIIEIGGENEELDIEAQEEDPGARTSHSYYTRSVARGEAKRREEENHTIAPLRQIMPMVGEKTRVKVPFSTSDLNNWRDEARNFRRNPEGVAKRFELMAKNLDIDWEDIEVMLSELTDTERELVLETGKRHAQVLSGRLEDNFPSSKPEWDPADPLVKMELGEGKKELSFLIDTGATFSVLNQELVPKSDEFVQVVGATGQPEKAYFLKPIKYKIGKQMGIHQFLYLPNSPKPLLGRDLLENLGAIIKFNKDKLEFQVNDEQLITALSLTISCVGPKPENHNFERILSKTYPLVWATDIPGKSKRATPIVVELKVGARPVVRKQYPLRIEDRKGIEPIIKRFLELGLLVECESDFNTPILPVKKPNGTYRLVQDLRAVNEITKTLHPVVANPYTLLTRLKDSLAWFTVLDLKDAFFCLPLAPESQRIFAFEWESVDRGRKTQLTWTRLPQGWSNSPTIFGNQLAKELEQWEGPPGDGALLQYVDDLLIATVTEEECIEWTISLLNFLGLSGYRVSQQKAQLVQKEVVYLGYEISRGQRSLGAARKEAICQMPKPETVRDLRAFLGMTGWCRLWIYQYGILAKPLYDLLKETKNVLVWTPEAEGAFKRLKRELMRAPALGLPDVSKPFWLFSHERQGMALGVLAQQLGPHKRAVAYFSKRLDEVSKGWPGCLRAVAAVIINIEEARKLTLGQKVTVLVSHTVSAVLEQKGNHWLSPSRFLKYQAILAESDDVTIQVTNIVNPASFLEGRAPAEPIEHDCLETIEAVYSSRPDLKEEPFEDADNWFSDGSSFVKQGVRMAGYAVTTTERVIESNPLPAGTSAQKAELIALTRALELAKDMQINIWTDSKYAFSVVHAHGAIWKERGLLTTQGKTVKHAEEVLRLLEAVQLPTQVAIMHCKGHLKGNTIPEIGNRKADTEAKLAAARNREAEIAALIPGELDINIQPDYQESDHRWIQRKKGKILGNDQNSRTKIVYYYKTRYVPV
ncbi:uncharacterized protein LOC131094601 [Melospiza georgiana]|uniref:uncharacterized protein LOC131094601 n=1 Tax=Melospiza georgiana TaxID=44398 RepID=UPI0025AB9823|nr:uncharacterized protein LOC131094601 [Melospiza georgiana]